MNFSLLRGMLIATTFFSAAASHAADGDWDFSPWSYTGGSESRIVTDKLNSQGAPSIGLSVDQAVSGSSVSEQSVSGGASSSFQSSVVVNTTPSTPASHSVITQLIYDPTLSTFGPEAGQGSVAAGRTGFNYRYRPANINALQNSTITLTLIGGAVFESVSGSSYLKYQQTAGGVGQSFVTYSWDAAAVASGSFFNLDGLIIRGAVSSISVERSGTYLTPGAVFSGSDNSLFRSRIDPAALLVPPVISDDSRLVSKTQPSLIDILTNDEADVTLDNAYPLVLSDAAAGTLSYLGSQIQFTPASGFTSAVTFQYQACNAPGSCAIATVTLTPEVVASPTAPVAVPVLGVFGLISLSSIFAVAGLIRSRKHIV
ncbi:Ig-like domain-containing protein [Comamonas sp.]|uniref:Ig-like domain-containing protein n=1 Tax=Comamonas sp. TaxID=34028 RepID=UPI00289E0FCA|nr:Ig-like domain-containing protein [Comamonas sp.]